MICVTDVAGCRVASRHQVRTQAATLFGMYYPDPPNSQHHPNHSRPKATEELKTEGRDFPVFTCGGVFDLEPTLEDRLERDSLRG